MLLGVLEMPEDLWADDPMDRAQRHSRYRQAAQRIRDDAVEIDRLKGEIDRLNYERSRSTFLETVSAIESLSWEQSRKAEEVMRADAALANVSRWYIRCSRLFELLRAARDDVGEVLDIVSRDPYRQAEGRKRKVILEAIDSEIEKGLDSAD